MTSQERSVPKSAPPAANRWLRFLIGLLMLGSSIAFFSSGYSPPGALGEVLRHNQEHDIDASPLFYSEVEHMQELEARIAERRESSGQ